jgi:hypothetical protein
MIRVAFNRNATWYRRFCSAHLSSRRRRNACPDTKIKRRNVEELLARLAAGRPTLSKYALELVAIARREAGLAGPPIDHRPAD